MALQYAVATRNNRLDEITSDIGSNGKLKIQTAAGATTLATLALSTTAAPPASGGVLVFSPISDDPDAANGGEAAQFQLTTSADAVIVTGSVTGTGGGGDIELSTTTIAQGDTVSITQLEFTEGNP